MSVRPPSSRRVNRVRSVATRAVVAGTAGLAAVAALAPTASALDDTTTDDTTAPAPQPEVVEPDAVEPEATAPVPETDEVLPTPETASPESAPAPSGEEAVAPELELAPYFGYQKYRVGVRVADGSYVPEGTTTAGTTFTITETADDGSTYTFTCTTSAETTTVDGSTFCLEDEADYPEEPDLELEQAPSALAVVEPGVDVDPEGSGTRDEEEFILAPGATVSVALASTPPNLRGVTGAAQVEPCVVADEGDLVCENAAGTFQTSAITFSLVGLPPVATDDAARTTVGVPVDIAVLPNDDTVLGAPLTGLALATAPSNGTAVLVGDVARYTPAPGFTGTDSFTYTLSTPNGTATATVRVVVEGGAIVRSSNVLPNTGGPDATLLGLAGLLLGGGGWVLARARREAFGADATV